MNLITEMKMPETPRVSRRHRSLRGWCHGNGKTIPKRDERTGGEARSGTAERLRIAVGGDRIASTLVMFAFLTSFRYANDVRQAERDSGQRSGLTTDEVMRLKELERENRKLRRSNEILRKASAFFAGGRRGEQAA